MDIACSESLARATASPKRSCAHEPVSRTGGHHCRIGNFGMNDDSERAVGRGRKKAGRTAQVSCALREGCPDPGGHDGNVAIIHGAVDFMGIRAQTPNHPYFSTPSSIASVDPNCC